MGAIWITGSSGASMILRLISNLIMTRFLLPDAFGMIALAMILVAAIELVSDIATQNESSQFVVVTTDVLKIWINRVGGDIVRVQLPKYDRGVTQKSSQ